MLEQLIQPITGPYSHSGFGKFISIKLGTLGYISAFKSSCKRARGPRSPLVRFWDNSVLLGFRSKPSTQLVCDAHQAGDLVRVTTKWTTCVLHRYRLTTSHRLVPSQQQVDSL